MIANFFLLTVCVVYNEAYVDITDDLDYAGVSGIFIPIKANLNTKDSDELTARQIPEAIEQAKSFLNEILSVADLLNKIKSAYREKKTEIEFYSGCIVDITFHDSSYTITAERPKCTYGLNLGKVVTKLFKSFNIDILSSGFIQSNKLILRSLSIEENHVSINAKYSGTYSHFQSMLRLAGISLQLDIPRNAPKKFKFVLRGWLNNFETSVKCDLQKKKSAQISIQVPSTTVENFIKTWGLQPSDLINSAFPFDKVKNAEISGSVTATFNTINKHFQLLAQFQYKDEVIDLSVNLILDKPKGEPVSVAFIANLGSIANIVDYLKQKFNYNGPDFIKHLITSGTLSISNKKIKMMPNRLMSNGKRMRSVKSGVHIYIKTDMKTALQNCADKPAPQRRVEVTESKNKKNQLITISILKTGVVIELPKNFTQDLKVLMKCFLKEMNIYVQTVVVPEFLENSKQDNAFYISELSFLNEEFKLTVAYNGDIDVPFLGLKISKPSLAISKKKGKDEPWIFKGHAEVISEELEDTSNKGNIDFTFDTKQNFEVNIKIPALEIKSLAKYFGVEPFEGGNKNLEERFSFGINDLYINGKLNLKERNGELTVTASPVINGMTGLKLAVLIWKLKEPQNSKSVGIAFGLVMKNLRLDRALKKFAGVEMPESWLSDVSIVMLASTADKDYCKNKDNENLPECEKPSKKSSSNSKRSDDEDTDDMDADNEDTENGDTEDGDNNELKNTHFETIEELRKIKIVQGLVLEASVRLENKDKCLGNGICEFLFTRGIKELSLKGAITSSSFRLEASISGEIKLGEESDVLLKEISLVLQFGSSGNKISVSCKFHTKNPKLEITGVIELDLCGKLKIVGTMAGMIEKPFNIEWLAFGNLSLSIGLDLKTALPSIEMGAEIWIGNLNGNSQELFKFQGYFGFDTANPLNSFFYARSFGADLTLENILRALGSTKTLPEMIASSGFIGEFIVAVSFYSDDINIPGLEFSVPPGYMLKGKISVFGYNIACDLKFNPREKAFFLNAMFDPINDWGAGAIQLYRSADEPESGPVLYININSNTFEVCIRGYISILGITASVDIQITNNKFTFEVHGNLFNVLTMSITIEASYANKRLESFKFNGCVGVGVIGEVTEAAKKVIEDARKKANDLFEAAQNTLAEVKRDIEAVRAQMGKWKKGLNDYRDKLKAREKQLQEVRKKKSGNCFKKCGTVCVPFFGWKDNCTYVWGYPVGCVTWDNCKWQAPNFVCIATCEIENKLTQFTSWAEQLGLKIMAGLTHIGDLFVDAAQRMTSIADGVVNLAQGLVDFAKKATDEILKAAADLMTIEISNICLNAEIDPNSKTCAGVNLEGSYMKRNFAFKGTMCFDSSAFASLGSTATKIAEPKIDKVNEASAIVNAKSNDVKLACKNMDTEAKRFENNVQTATTAEIKKRSHVPTEEEVRLHKLIYDPLPNVNLRSDETNSALKNVVPWEYLSAEYINNQVVFYRNNVSVRHKIPNEESGDFCHQHQNVLSRYGTIADSFTSAISNANKAKEGYMNKKKSYLNELDYLNGLVRSGPLNNMTLDEQQDILHWRDYTESHIKSFIDKATAAFHGRRRDSINHVRQVLSDAIESDRNVKLPEYIKYLHSLAVKADKKSQIDKEPNKDNTVYLHHIKEILLNVASDDHMPSIELAKGIGKVQKMLSDMKRSSIPCAA
ncbi:uncharacterized protein LOC136092364 isoform X1 [Hydra vulgaris]|uniref:Uncharacterized protein LOC136092364 isoform X1 n=1 Tax=Hydra vulgaris TaxID=6087 RepID=A0ABM4DPK5_HYDVU